MDQNVVILCKNYSEYIKEFENCLSKNNIDFLLVCDSLTLDIDKDLLDLGFYNLTRSPYIKKPSAWDKSFYYIKYKNLCDLYNYFFFIEDDVYSYQYLSIVNFILECKNYDHDLITKCVRPQSHHPTWKHWKEEYIKEFKFPSQSFNPICRLSKKLIEKIFDYQLENKKFNFHEIIFPSICLENNFSYMNYIKNDETKKYIGSMQYTPVLTRNIINDLLIYHPVKESKDEREKPIVCLDSCE